MPVDLEDIQLFTVAEVCERLRIKKTKAYALMNEGELDTVTLGGQRLVPAETLRQFIGRLPKSKPAETARSAVMRHVQRSCRRRGRDDEHS
jgi:excisionase family DNA binding protein